MTLRGGGQRKGAAAMTVPEVRRISSGTTWEPVVGYSRAVAAGDFVFVSGCTSVDGAEFVHPGDAYAQTRQAISNAAGALAGLGASLADVVQTRMYVTDISRWQEYGRAHGEFFGEVRPAATMIEVAALIEAGMLIEIEVVACISPRSGLLVGIYQVRGHRHIAGFSYHHGVFRTLADPSATVNTEPQCASDRSRLAGFYTGKKNVTTGFRFTPGKARAAGQGTGVSAVHGPLPFPARFGGF